MKAECRLTTKNPAGWINNPGASPPGHRESPGIAHQFLLRIAPYASETSGLHSVAYVSHSKDLRLLFFPGNRFRFPRHLPDHLHCFPEIGIFFVGIVEIFIESDQRRISNNLHGIFR